MRVEEQDFQTSKDLLNLLILAQFWTSTASLATTEQDDGEFLRSLRGERPETAASSVPDELGRSDSVV